MLYENTSPSFTFTPVGKLVLNYARSSGTHPSYTMLPKFLALCDDTWLHISRGVVKVYTLVSSKEGRHM